MRFVIRPAAVALSALLITGLTGAVSARADGPTPAPADQRINEISRAAARTALDEALDQRRDLLTKASLAIAQEARQMAADSFVKQRQKAETTVRKQAVAKAKAKKLGFEFNESDPREIARQMMKNKYGWGDDQFSCYNNIIMRESEWKWNADNPTSSAYGIPQALPGSKMASAGADWRTNPATQIKWGLGYVKDRFGTPCSAWAFKQSHGWY